MNNKAKNITVLVLTALIVFGFFVWCLVKPSSSYSDSERRSLETFPELSIKTLLNGDFMSKFEDYTLDQFPMRDNFRTVKNMTAFYLMGQLESNDLYTYDGYIAQVEYPLNNDSIINAADKFGTIYRKYLADTDCNVYFSVVPDKNMYLSDESGRIALDYELLASLLGENLDGFEYIDIYDLLDYTDYYRTDTHWRQEKIYSVAQRLAEKMGVTLNGEYETFLATDSFDGVYKGQMALPIASDDMYYVTNEVLKNCIVTNGETGETMPMYVDSKLSDRDPYEYFLGGSLSLVTIENPNATTDKELIIFRDSFGSSIAPYFAEGYSKVTLVDIRYIHSSILAMRLDYTDQDVLFLYSSLVLNNSETIKG